MGLVQGKAAKLDSTVGRRMIHLILACLTAGGGWAVFSPLRSEAPLFNSPLAMPSPLATPYAIGLPGNWSYYQLWFKGEYDESAREFLRQLGSGNLPYEGNYTWLVWAGHEPRVQWELMAQLEEWALDSRPAIRQRTGQVIADLGSASPPLRGRAADLLVRMICREPDQDTRRALLYRMSWYFHDLNHQDVRSIAQCVAGDLENTQVAMSLLRFDLLDQGTISTICQFLTNPKNLTELMSPTVYRLCADEASAVQLVQLRLDQFSTNPSVYFDNAMSPLFSDERHSDALAEAVLKGWPEKKWTDYYVIKFLGQIGGHTSPDVSNRIAHALLAKAETNNDAIEALSKLPLSPEMRPQLMALLEKQAQDPARDIYGRSSAAGWYGYLATNMDTQTQRRALDLNLALWENPDSLDPFYPSALTAVNRLAPLLGEIAVQQSISASLTVIATGPYPLHRMRAIENLDNLTSYASVTTTAQVADALVRIVRGGSDHGTRGSACVTLAQLAPRLDTGRQAQIAQAILAAFREGPIRYSVPKNPATDWADCSLHTPAVSALGLLAASPSLNSETRRSVITALAEILFEPLDDCNYSSRMAAARALGDASHFISSTLAFTVTSNLIAVNPDPRSEAVYQTQVALARIEATQTLYYGQRLDELLAKFAGATTEKDINSYGAALFLTAACNAYQRPTIRAALSNIRDSLSSNTMAAGELVAMISLLDIASEAGQSPPRLDATRPFSRLFALCLDAMGGDNKMHKSFCPIKE